MANNRAGEVAPGVFRLGDEFFNWYLVDEGGRYTVIDSGLPAHYQQLLDTLAYLGGTVGDIEAVLLTHAHLDHVGLAARIQHEAGAAVYLHPADQSLGKRGGAQLPPVGLLANSWRSYPRRLLTSAVVQRVFFSRGIGQPQSLINNQELGLPGRPQVIASPGHTAGSVSFWLPDRQALFAGDALVTIDMLTGASPGPQLTPRNVGTDREQSIDSLTSFETLGQVTLLTGHGEPWSGTMSTAVELALHVDNQAQPVRS